MQKKPRNCVLLCAYDGDAIVERHEPSYEEYYQERISLIDSNDYRAAKGIRRVTGEVYDSKGRLRQRFETVYGTDGRYLNGRAVHDDGTVIEN